MGYSANDSLVCVALSRNARLGVDDESSLLDKLNEMRKGVVSVHHQKKRVEEEGV